MNNAGFLSTQSVRENQLANLSKQIDELKKENDKLEDFNEELMEERNRLNNIINELEKELEKDFHTFMCNSREVGKTYKAGGNNYREHILLRLRELKGSDK